MEREEGEGGLNIQICLCDVLYRLPGVEPVVLEAPYVLVQSQVLKHVAKSLCHLDDEANPPNQIQLDEVARMDQFELGASLSLLTPWSSERCRRPLEAKIVFQSLVVADDTKAIHLQLCRVVV